MSSKSPTPPDVQLVWLLPGERIGSVAPEFLVMTNLRVAPSVSQQPSVEVDAWRVIELPDGERFLICVPRGTQTLRTTTCINRVNAASRIVETHSGRIYHLECPPMSDDGTDDWASAMSIYAMHRFGPQVDKSMELWRMFLSATQ